LFDGPVKQGWITDLCVDVCMRDLYFENPELLEGGLYVSAPIRSEYALGSLRWKLRLLHHYNRTRTRKIYSWQDDFRALYVPRVSRLHHYSERFERAVEGSITRTNRRPL
jgi:hypothetical protein